MFGPFKYQTCPVFRWLLYWDDLYSIFCLFQVDIEVNDVPVTIHMKLDDNGAAYFVEMIETDEEDEEIHPGYNSIKFLHV